MPGDLLESLNDPVQLVVMDDAVEKREMRAEVRGLLTTVILFKILLNTSDRRLRDGVA